MSETEVKKPSGKTPIWGGSTGGLLSAAYTEEK